MHRIALVCNSRAPDLISGAQDAQNIFNILTSRELGQCDADNSKCLLDCTDRTQYDTALRSVLSSWAGQNQLVLYYSGHGIMRGSRFCFVFGEQKDDFLPFSNVISDLDAAGVTKALIIIDACHAGGARLKGEESLKFEVLREAEIPNGMALLASSHEDEWSAEFDDGAGSVFTYLLCDAVNTGLGGTATNDGLITVPDVTNYVTNRIRKEEKLKKFLQTPNYQAHGVDRSIWLARNSTSRIIGNHRAADTNHSADLIRSVEELKFIYEMTHHLQRPCPNSTPDFIDWNIVRSYAASIGVSKTIRDGDNQLLEQLGLLVPMGRGSAQLLHFAATLCFCANPERVIPSSYSLFISGEISDPSIGRREVRGPLIAQIEELTRLTIGELRVRSDFTAGLNRSDKLEIPQEIIREAISNAVVHRNYEAKGTVQVWVTQEEVTVSNPGRFPDEATWKDLINGPRVSCPANGAIALYVSRQMGMEGIGRGFEIFRRYINEYGEGSITFSETTGPTTLLTIKRRPNEHEDTPNVVASGLAHDYFVGRQDIMEHIKFNLSEARVTFLVGQRGSGKTTVLTKIMEQLDRKRVQIIFVNASSCMSFTDFIGLFFESVDKSSLSFSSSRTELEELRDFHSSTVRTDLTKSGGMTIVRDLMRRLMRLLERRSSSLAIIIDDFDVYYQNVLNSGESNRDVELMFFMMSDFRSEFPRLSWVISTSRKDIVFRNKAVAHSASHFHFITMLPLSEREVGALVERVLMESNLQGGYREELHDVVKLICGLRIRHLRLILDTLAWHLRKDERRIVGDAHYLVDICKSPDVMDRVFSDVYDLMRYNLADGGITIRKENLALIFCHIEGVVHARRMDVANIDKLKKVLERIEGLREMEKSLYGILEELMYEGIIVDDNGKLAMGSHFMRALSRKLAKYVGIDEYSSYGTSNK